MCPLGLTSVATATAATTTSTTTTTTPAAIPAAAAAATTTVAAAAAISKVITKDYVFSQQQPLSLKPNLCIYIPQAAQSLLGGSWLVISRVLSRRAIFITHILQDL